MRTLAEVLGVLLLVIVTTLFFRCRRGSRPHREQISRPSERREPVLRQIYNVLTGEWLLRGRANGGDIILIRSFLISMTLYAPATALHSWASSGWSLDFDLGALGRELSETLPWLGAIFAGSYVALYTRFSAQWSYLAGVYNQIMAAECAIAEPTARQRVNLDIWSAGFIEDAVTLHLATKRVFAEIIWIFLEIDGVRAAFDESSTAGVDVRKRLQADLKRLYPHFESTPPDPAAHLPLSTAATWIPR